MELICQVSTICHHISAEASEFLEIIQHRIRNSKGFVVLQGKESCQGAGSMRSVLAFFPELCGIDLLYKD